MTEGKYHPLQWKETFGAVREGRREVGRGGVYCPLCTIITGNTSYFTEKINPCWPGHFIIRPRSRANRTMGSIKVYPGFKNGEGERERGGEGEREPLSHTKSVDVSDELPQVLCVKLTP